MIFLVFFISIFLWVVYTYYRLYRIYMTMKKFKIMPIDSVANELIHEIRELKSVPNHPIYWNFMRTIYYLVKESEMVLPETKKNLREIMSSKGVYVG